MVILELIGASASIATLLHVASKLYALCEAAYKSKKEQAKLKRALDILSLKLKQLQTLEANAREFPDDPRYANVRAILASSNRFQGKTGSHDENSDCGVLGGLKRAMQETEADLTPKHGHRARARRLLWHHERKPFQQLIVDITDWTESVNSILIGETFERMMTVEDKIDDSSRNKEIKALERRRIAIVAWLSSLRFKERQSELLNKTQTTLFQPVLLTTDEFEMWKEGRPWLLHCQGKPGSGKTVLCAIAIKHLTEVFRHQDIPILCVYLDHKQRYGQSLENLIAALLKQLIQKHGAEFRSPEAKRLYQGAENESRPSTEEFFIALRAELKHHERFFIIVDALDEAAPNVRAMLLERLHMLANDKASIMITSQRPEDGMRTSYLIKCNECDRQALKVYFRCPICDDGNYYLCNECVQNGIHCNDDDHELEEPQEVLVDIEPSADAMKNFVMAELEAEERLGFSGRGGHNVSTFATTPLGRLLRRQPSLKIEILDSVVAKADGMFELAALYMRSLKSLGLSEAEILDMLEKPPEGYSGFYEQYMDRICAVGPGDPFGHAAILGRRVLAWVFCTKRSLSLSELLDALAVDLKKPGFFNPTAKYDKATIVDVIAGLVTIDNNSMNGDEAVKPNHLSAQQYFDENRDRWFPDVAAEISRVAIHYISLKPLSAPCENDWEDKEFEMRKVDYPFLQYAYEFWGDHAAEAAQDPAVQAAVMQFVNNPDRIATFIQAAWYLKSSSTAEWDVRKGANALHITAWFGLTQAVSALLDQGLDVNSTDPKYHQTALMYACRRGQTATVSLLLGYGADANLYSRRGSCAIHEAVTTGNLEVIDALLAHPRTDVNAPHFMRSGMTALSIAAQERRSETAMALLSHNGINIKAQDRNGVTALSHAIEAGCDKIAWCILELDTKYLDLDSKDWKGSTALSIAASGGRDDIVEKLLSKGANPYVKDGQNGGTALLRAVDNGHMSTVRIMLQHGVHDTSTDDQDRGLLHGAAVSGRDDIVQLLIDRGLDPNSVDKKGRTPLHDASREGHFTTVKILQDRGARPSVKDNSKRTPWTVAWENGHNVVLKVLSHQSPYELTEQDYSGEYPNAEELPAWSLARLGKKQLIAQFIANKRNEVFFPDPDTGNTALHWAVSSDELEIAEMLLHVKVLLNVRNPATAKNEYSRTPLHSAALKGNLSIMKSLLERVDEDTVNSPDQWGTPPIELAYTNWHLECCLLLIEAGADIPPTKQTRIQHLFFLAIEFGRLGAVINLVNMGADVQVKNTLGLSGLQLAQEGGKTDIENYLRNNKSIFVNSLETEIAQENDMIASMTLRDSPFHRPGAWLEDDEAQTEGRTEEAEQEMEKEEKTTEKEDQTVANEATEETFWQQLSELHAPHHDPSLDAKIAETGRLLRAQKKDHEMISQVE